MYDVRPLQANTLDLYNLVVGLDHARCINDVHILPCIRCMIGVSRCRLATPGPGNMQQTTVWDEPGGQWTRFEATFENFCVTKFRQNSSDFSKKMACAKFWPHVIRDNRGPLSSRGPYAHVRTVSNG